MKRIISVIMLIVMCLSLTLSVSAATISKATHKSPQYGGGSATVFYVNAKNKNTTKLNYSSTSWGLVEKNGVVQGASAKWQPGYFEIQIWGRNKTGDAWNYIKKENKATKLATTISMKGYTQYKVRVYAWKTSTIGKTIGGKWDSSAYWSDGYAPECTFTAGSNVKSLAK